MATADVIVPETSLVTLIVDRGGKREDLAFPAGITLKEALTAVGIGQLSPATIDGRIMRPEAVLGRDIVSGTLVLLRDKGWETGSEITRIDHSAEVRATTLSITISTLAIILGLLAGAVGLTIKGAGESAAHLVPEPWVYFALIGVLALFALLLACRDPYGKPLLEVGGPVALIFGASSLLSFANPGDHTHQVLIATMLGTSMVSLVRWVYCGRYRPDTGNVCIDAALLTLAIALLDVGVMSAGLPIEFTAAVVFGLCPPLLAAMSGFSIRVSSDVLLDSESVIREAPAVRSAPVDEEAARPDVGKLMAISSARNSFWVTATCLGLVVTTPAMANLLAVEGWRGTVAFLAFLAAVAACLLVPRSSSSRLVRILPRVSAATILAIVIWSGTLPFTPLTLAIGLALIGLLFLGASLLVREGRPFYGFSRIGDILQTLSVSTSLPLALAAIGVISLVRTGGLG